MKSVLRLLSMANALWLKNWVSGSGKCIYTHWDGIPSISSLSFPSVSPGGADGLPDGDGLPGRGAAGSGGGAAVPLRLQPGCGLCGVQLWHGRQPAIPSLYTIAGWLSIVAFPFICPGNSTPNFFPAQTSAGGFFISCYESSTAARNNPHLAIFAIVKAKRRSDYSSCTRPPRLAIVADRFKTYKKLFGAAKRKLQLLPQPYRTL